MLLASALIEGICMAFIDELKQLAEQIRKRQPNVKGEEATKQALILPFLQMLAFDIYDPTVVRPEFIADFAKKKANGQMEKVDFALHAGGHPIIFIECKAVDAPLPTHDAQLARYFNAVTSVKVAIITDGLHYRFFTDLSSPNQMDERPFFEFNVLQFNERDVETLSHYKAGEFRSDQVQKHAQELLFIDQVGGLLSELMRNPSEEFVKFLLSQLDLVPGKVTAKVVERFVPIVRTAFAGAVMEITTRGLSQTMTALSAPPPIPIPTVPASPIESAPEGGNDAAKVVTTAEELDLFERVKKIVAQSTVKAPVAYKDTATYFAVNLGTVRRWFLRFFGNGSTKYIVLRMPHEALKASLDATVATPLNAMETRVNVSSGADVDRFSAAIMAVYEAEVRRKDTDPGTDSAAGT